MVGNWASEGTPDRPAYRSYLVRCWREESVAREGGPPWRFIVQEVGVGQARRAFADLDDLVAYLRRELGDGQPREDLDRVEEAGTGDI